MKLGNEDKRKLFANLVRVRCLDRQLVEDVQAQKGLPFFHSQQGQ